MRYPLLPPLILLLAACGGERERTLPAGPWTTVLDAPSDLPRELCVAGSLAGLTPEGIWHQELRIDGGGAFPWAWRFAEDGQVQLGGTPVETRLDADDLFLRRVDVESQARWRVLALDACAQPEAGRLTGPWAACFPGDECLGGSFQSVRVEPLPEPPAEGLTLLGAFAGPPGDPWTAGVSLNVRVEGDLAYVVRGTDGLRVVDVADPEAMRERAHLPGRDRDYFNDVKLVGGPEGGRFALLASDRRGVVVVDVSTPGAPVEVGRFPEEGAVDVHTLFVETRDGRTLAYLANVTKRGLDVYDVTDPRAPVFVVDYVDEGVGSTPGALVHDLYVDEGRAYLAYWSLGLVIVDVFPEPAEVRVVGRFDDYPRRTSHSVWVTTTSGGRRIAVHGDEDWGAHARILDVDPGSATFLQELGAFSLRPEVSIHNVMAFGDRAFIAWYQDGIRVLDVSDPARPAPLAHHVAWHPQDPRYGNGFFEGAVGLDVDLARGRIYVAESDRGLLILGLLLAGD